MNENVNLGSLALGVTTLVTLIGGLSINGTVGRVLRNDPAQLRFALVLVILGTALLALSALPATEGGLDHVFSVAGMALALAGILVGALAGAGTGAINEHPVVTAKLTDDGLHLEGGATVGNLKSNTRLVLVVDGLVRNGAIYDKPVTLQQSYVGPDGEGDVSLPVDLRLPAGRFDAIGVQSWTAGDRHAHETRGTTPFGQRPCATYPVSVDEHAGTGCVVLPLASVPVSPNVSLSWGGNGASADRLMVGVKAAGVPSRSARGERACAVVTAEDGGTRCSPGNWEGTRVVLQVKARLRGKGSRLLYEGLLRPDAHGQLDTTIQLPVARAYELVCAQARFAYSSLGFPTRSCPPAHRGDAGWAFAELRSPGAALWESGG